MAKTRIVKPEMLASEDGESLLPMRRREWLAMTAATIALCVYDVQSAGAQTIVVRGDRTKDDSGRLRAPRIKLISNSSYPPRIDVDLDESYVVGDSLQLQGATTSSFANPVIDLTVPIDVSLATAGQAIVAALGTIKAPAKTLFRVRGVRAGAPSPWSTIVLHGDSVPPKILSSASPRFAENSPVAHLLTADKDVRWTILPSADASRVELRDGNVITLAGDASPDFEAKQSYALVVKASDLAGNTAIQTLVLRITDIEESSPTLWGAAIKSPYVSLGNGYLTVTASHENVGAGCRVRATNARTGKRYFEVHVDRKSHEKNFIGLCSSLVNIVGQYDQVGLTQSEGASLAADGSVFHNGTAERNPALAFATGDTVMIAFDTAAKMIWFGKNGVWQGKPATGIGGYSMGSTEDFYAFAAVCATLGDPNALTADFGATPFAFPPPRGFTEYH